MGWPISCAFFSAAAMTRLASASVIILNPPVLGLLQSVQISGNVAGIVGRDAQVGHHRLFIYGFWIFDPTDHVIGCVLQDTGNVDAVCDSGERWAGQTGGPGDPRNDVTGTAAVILDLLGSAAGVSAGGH